jgi:hypothetical protein
MKLHRFLIPALLVATASQTAQGQGNPSDQRPRLLLESQFGSARSLGFKFPSVSFGLSLELPFRRRFEFQTATLYSPDRKFITNDGNGLKVSGSLIAFVTSRLGAIGTVERSALWTSQFAESGWPLSMGAVIRNDYLGQGRLYVSYVFPTGCVWATASNPCTLQSKRLQGVHVRQDVRNGSHQRWGFDFGIYHFCDQANQNEPQAGRHCHIGGTAMVTLSMEFHVGRSSRYRLNGNSEDNF